MLKENMRHLANNIRYYPRRYWPAIFILLSVLLFASKSWADQVDTMAIPPLQGIQEIGRKGDFVAMEKLEQQVEVATTTQLPNRSDYFIVLASTLGTYRFGKEARQAAALAKKCAFLALDNPDKISLTYEISMIKILRENTSYSLLSEHEKKQIAGWTLHCVQRITATTTIGPPEGMIFTHPPLPKGVTGWTGMSPKRISNPTLRAEYEKSISQNEQRVQQSNDFQEAVRAAVHYLPLAEKNLLAYSKTLGGLANLKELFERYKIDDSIRRRVLVVEQH